MVKPRQACRALALAFCIGCLAGTVQAEGNDPESRLLGAVQQLTTAERLEPAINDLEQLTLEQPGFKLAQLVYADMLMARAGALNNFGNHSRTPDKAVTDLQEEFRMRWRHYTAPPDASGLPSQIIRLASHQQHAIIVDASKSRLYLFANRDGKPQLLVDFYISVGKQGVGKLRQGDQKTPLGVYQATRFIADDKLPDFYGSGAFPLDYPNNWDRRLGRTGYGIWLHGTPWNTYSRPPRASDGCVAISNDDFAALVPFVDIRNTPIVLTEHIDWLAEADWLKRRARFVAMLTGWQADWESLDTDRYLAHYSRDFNNGGQNYQRFAAHKQKVNRGKSFIDVQLDELNLFSYPGEPGMFEARFTQRYRSSNFSHSSEKKQYWKQSADGQWRIVYEGPA